MVSARFIKFFLSALLAHFVAMKFVQAPLAQILFLENDQQSFPTRKEAPLRELLPLSLIFLWKSMIRTGGS